MKNTFELAKHIKKVPILALFIIVGCDSEKISTTDVPNLCAELGGTTRGFSGPSKRMDIMKSYGLKPVRGEQIESVFEMNFSFEELATTLDGMALSAGANCIRGLKMSCTEIVNASGSEATWEKLSKKVTVDVRAACGV